MEDKIKELEIRLIQSEERIRYLERVLVSKGVVEKYEMDTRYTPYTYYYSNGRSGMHHCLEKLAMDFEEMKQKLEGLSPTKQYILSQIIAKTE